MREMTDTEEIQTLEEIRHFLREEPTKASLAVSSPEPTGESTEEPSAEPLEQPAGEPEEGLSEVLSAETPVEPSEGPAVNKPKKRVRKILRIVGNVIFGLILACVALMIFFMIRSKATGTPPMIFGHYVFIVLSGSMEPSIHTGGVVIVKPVEAEEIAVGDTITFSGFAGSKALTTHRVVEVTQDEANGPVFLTKGDANEDPDPNMIPAENVVGKAVGSVPLLGYFMKFVQTKQGLMTFILVPAVLFIVYEVINYLRKRGAKDDVKAEVKHEKKKT
jgi:signal peptidase